MDARRIAAEDAEHEEASAALEALRLPWIEERARRALDPSGAVFNVRNYGAKGDGIADDFDAVKRAVAAFRAAGGGTLLFPPGTYRIDRVEPDPHAGLEVVNGAFVGDTVGWAFIGMDGFKISGYGARLDMKGDFHRPAVNLAVPGNIATLTAFNLWHCSNFQIEGFEVDGNVDRMTREGPGVYEFYSYGVVTNGCSNYTLRDLYIHHYQTDGFALGVRGAEMDRNAILINCRSEYNARQGLSITGLQNGTFTNCDFSHTGRAAGSYGVHAPGAGLDVEPEGGRGIIHHLHFVRCRFEDNRGTQLTCGNAATTQDITFEGCTFRGATPGLDFSVIFTPKRGTMRQCLLDTDVSALAVSYPGNAGSDVTLSECRIRHRKFGIMSLQEAPAVIEGCTIECYSTTPLEVAAPYIVNAKLHFLRNRVFRNAASFHVELAGVADQAAIVSAAECRGNTWDTDYIAPAGAPANHFFTDYGGTPVVADEHYPKRTFRRALNAPSG